MSGVDEPIVIDNGSYYVRAGLAGKQLVHAHSGRAVNYICSKP